VPLFNFPRVETAGRRRIVAQISPANAGGDHGPCALNRGSETVWRLAATDGIQERSFPRHDGASGEGAEPASQGGRVGLI